jgi:hypothetical protein
VSGQVPSVGRIVHYVSHGTPVRPDGSQAYTQQCRAALITEVGQWVTTDEDVEDLGDAGRSRTLHQIWYSEACSLFVTNPTGVFLNGAGAACRHDEDLRLGGTWHWPERV